MRTKHACCIDLSVSRALTPPWRHTCWYTCMHLLIAVHSGISSMQRRTAKCTGTCCMLPAQAEHVSARAHACTSGCVSALIALRCRLCPSQLPFCVQNWNAWHSTRSCSAPHMPTKHVVIAYGYMSVIRHDGSRAARSSMHGVTVHSADQDECVDPDAGSSG